MPSLTPEHRRDEVTSVAFNDGIVNGVMMFVPTLGGLFLAMKNPTFRKITNAQSRTALAIMPPLFIFAVTSEQKLTHKMHEVASESEHNLEVSLVWADCLLVRRLCSSFRILNHFRPWLSIPLATNSPNNLHNNRLPSNNCKYYSTISRLLQTTPDHCLGRTKQDEGCIRGSTTLATTLPAVDTGHGRPSR